MSRVTVEKLLDAGVHFGHLTQKWNPKMAPYIFMEKNGIHLIDLYKTQSKIDEASAALKNIIKSGRKVLFVATKKQAKELVSAEAKKLNMPHVCERWLGGMLTNYATVRKSVKKMQLIEKMATDGTFENINKKEKLMKTRERIKLEKILGGIADMNRLPAALIIVDIKREHIAVAEATRLNIPIIGLVDTNSDPNLIDFPIPANDDAAKSIAVILEALTEAIIEGMQERKKDKEDGETEEAETAAAANIVEGSELKTEAKAEETTKE